ncbi:PEP-CTERM sorting domain-containing protein [Coleofasciculus chthonoplastes]
MKDTESVPEPATWTALGLLFAGLLWSRAKTMYMMVCNNMTNQ